jgi:hypothetical protein
VWERLDPVWCRVSASVFPAPRWFPAKPLSFRGRRWRQAFEPFLESVRPARVFVPEPESAPLVPVFAVAWESVRGALE